MPESRDRLVRTVDIAAEYARWRLGLSSDLFDRPRPLVQPISEGTGPITIRTDRNLRTRRIADGAAGGRNYLRWMRMPAAMARGTPVTVRGSSSKSRGRAVNSPLSSWYPRAPLQDITTVAQAYDQRRELLRLTDGGKYDDQKAPGSPSPDSSYSTFSVYCDASAFKTPYPSGIADSRDQLLGKILIREGVNKKSSNNLEFLTPQRELLNKIDTVSKVVLEKIKQFNETPLMKKAERERKVCVLMSMR
ncbi:hypothetical protein MLD38_014850 [Melastoma candidum]|uniref:Uncharacterized protein n=1 Tax=Melastoma candidum TaxID=119954 RepID=A0ACB9RE74_9MYRT|nr:hypothetical protein MLD38_014850 [Melastoma candidum]